MDDPFFRSYVHAEHRLFGRRLAPFNAAHALLLQALRSPLATGEPFRAGDLLVATRLCAHAWPFGLALHELLRPSLRDIAIRLLLDRRPALLRLAQRAWEAYTEDYAGGPEFWETEVGGAEARALTAPHLLVLISKYRRYFGASRQEAWTVPLPALRWEIAAAEEQLDGADILFVQPGDDEEDDLIDLTAYTEEQLYDLAVRDLGKERADEWLRQRKEAR